MADESLNRRLAMIAREIQSRENVGETANEIAVAAHEMLPNAAGAGITLVHRRREVETAAATSDVVRMGDRLQYELHEGPCLDAAWEQEQVYAGDLAADDRWPRWGPQVARDLGVGSMLCTQLFTNEDQLGALNVYAAERYAFDTEDKEVAHLLAAHGAVAVAAAQEIQGLRLAVDHRTTIGKALGVVMARYELDDDQAMAVLRRLSSHGNRKLFDVALDVVRQRRLPPDEAE